MFKTPVFPLFVACLLNNTGTASLSGPYPNFIIFLADSLGYGDVGYNGHPTVKTPNINKLSLDGMILSQCYSGSSYMSSSMSSILTGRAAIRYGLMGGWNGGSFSNTAIGGLPNSEVTFISILKQIGYNSMLIGQWNLGQRKQYLPFNFGFDHYYGIPSFNLNSSQINQALPPLALLDNDTIIEQPVDLSALSQKYLQKAIQFIQSNEDTTQPFVLFLAFNPIHDAQFVNGKFCNVSRRGIVGDSVAEMDDMVGTIMQHIFGNSQLQNTLTFFTSNRGAFKMQNNIDDGSSGLFKGGMGTCWEGGYRVPFIAHWSGVIEKESRSMDVVSNYDIFMTIISIVNGYKLLAKDKIYDSMDISQVLFNNNNEHNILHERCLMFYGGTPFSKDCPYLNNQKKHILCQGLWAMRCNQYKLHWITKDIYHNYEAYNIHDPPLLFNINWDPSEKHPIFSHNSVNVYDKVVNNMIQQRIEFDLSKSTMRIMENQIVRGSSTEYGLCCNHQTDCICNQSDLNEFVCKNTNVVMPTYAVNNNMWTVTWIIFLVTIIGLCLYAVIYKRIHSTKSYQRIPDPPRKIMTAYMQQY